MASLLTQIKVRKDIYENIKDLVLAQGEPGFAHDTGDYAVGDGTNKFSDICFKLQKGITNNGTSTDNAIARFDGTTGRVIQDSTATISDDGHLFIDTTSDTTMTTPAIKVLHTGPVNGSSYADLMELAGYEGAPYGFKFRTYGDGTAIIQSQRIRGGSGEKFSLSLNPDGGDVLIGGKVIQGTKNTDSTIASMNQFTSDLYVKGDGSAPNSPKVAGFYLGKSAGTDENRHMDIVTGSTVSYIDFNRAGTVRDYDVRLRVNNSTGDVHFQWSGDYAATQKVLKADDATFEAAKIVKTGGNNTHVLLDGGDTKAVSDFAMKSDIPADYVELVIAESTSTTAGKLSPEELAAMIANPHKTVLVWAGFYCFAENLSSTTSWYYTATPTFGTNSIDKKVITVKKGDGTWTYSSMPYVDQGATAVATTGEGNAFTGAAYDSDTRTITFDKGSTFLTSHQSIKTLNTNNTTAQTVNASEAIAGSGTINLHKISKTGNAGDLIAGTIPNDRLPYRLQAYCGIKVSSSSDINGIAKADDATEQGFYYVNSGDSKKPSFKQVDTNTSSPTGSDYHVFTTAAYNSDWIHQLGFDCRSNDLFVRRKQNGTWQPWTSIVKFQPCTGSNGNTMGTITDNAIPRWDTTRNTTLQNSGVTIDDSNNVTTPGTMEAVTIKKTGGADTHVLLAGGGTKAVDDFQPAGDYLTEELDTLQTVTDRDATTTNGITVDTLSIGNTTATGHINFARGGWNYIKAPNTNSIIGFITGKSDSLAANATLAIDSTSIFPGWTDGAKDIGSSSYQWNNIYMKGNIVKGSYTLTLPSKTGTVALLDDIKAGTVTSVGVDSTSLTVTGSPITSSGTITIEHPTATVTTADIYKIGKDDYGHVVIGDKITPADLGLSTVYRYMGTKTWAGLKALTSAKIGDVYSITDKDPDGNTNADWACYTEVTAACTDANYTSYWQSLGGKVDLAAYVQGPASSTTNAIARYDGTTGKLIKDSSGVTIDDNNKLKINATDTGGQSNVFQALSTSASVNSANWIGRSIMGSKTLTFLMGTYKNMAAVGAHSWTDANAGTGANWAPMYFQPDGGASAAIYMGQNGSGWTADTGTLVVKGSATANAGTVDVNGTFTATTVKKTGGADTHVLLAGGGTKALSDFTTGGGSIGDYVTLTTPQTISGNKTFTGKNIFEASNGYNTTDTQKFLVGNSSSAFCIGGDGLQCFSGTNSTTGKTMYINYYGGSVEIGKSSGTQTINLHGTVKENGTALSSKYAAIGHNHDDVYLKAEVDTLQSVTDRGATTTQTITALSYSVNGSVTMEYDSGYKALKFKFA